ncbi:MAG: FAD-binding oxidoreductase [Candidatus Helarchaeota archaeon]
MENEKLDKLLSSIFDKESYSTDRAIRFAYSMDVSKHEYLPDAVVMPKNKENIIHLVELAYRHHIPLIPRGAGTGASGGALAVHGGIIIDFSKMNKIIELDIENLSVIVEPGIIHADLNKFLQPHGFFFPVIPGSSDMCTLGGMVGNNASGLRAVKYGTTKDYVLDLEVVLPEGKLAHLGSKVLKTASGYDLLRLFVGSEGTLGIITQITLKIIPLPEARGLVTAFFSSVEYAGKTVLSIFSEKIMPSAMELLDKSAIFAVNAYERDINLPDAEAMLLIELDGIKESVNIETRRVYKICKKNHAFQIDMTTDETERIQLWSARKLVGAAARRLREGYARVYEAEDITVPLSEIPKTLLRLRELSNQFDIPIVVFGHIGDGNLHPAILIKKEDPEHWKKLTELTKLIHYWTIDVGGSVTGEHGIGLTRAEYLSKERPSVLELMRKIKRAIDPNNLMNPGKMDLDGGYS